MPDRRPQASRAVQYRYTGQFDESAMERLLSRAVERGVVVPGQYDTGRGSIVWFNGRPGPAMRDLCGRVRALIRT